MDTSKPPGYYQVLLDQAIQVDPTLDVNNNHFVIGGSQDKYSAEAWYDQVYTVSRADKRYEGLEQFLGAQFNGTFYCNLFRTSHPICLYDIGFFGPFNLSTSSHVYNIQMELFQSAPKEVYPSCRVSDAIARVNTEVMVYRDDKIFYVSFGEPITLKSGKWYAIQFKIEGPDLRYCAKTIRDVNVPIAEGKEIKFSFNNGSKQMPKIRFGLQNL